MKVPTLTHKFVDLIPDELESNVLYVSLEFATVTHCCCCGCGREVVTPLSPTDWQMTFDGESVSLQPSIGNWSFPCRSHYWVKEGEIHWAENWSDEKIKSCREIDKAQKDNFFGSEVERQTASEELVAPEDSKNCWWSIKRLIGW